MRDGRGKFYYQDGGLYDGEWRENKMSGHGKLFYQSGKIAYDGEWSNDQFTGFGVLYNEEPVILHRPFDYNNLDDIDEYWTRFEGTHYMLFR
jgi:antitoxin component YwqK of YwqJK toxin-antitoxin module